VDVSTRRLIIRRAAQFFDSGVVPQSWEALTLEQQIRISESDPELVQVWRGQMPAELEERVLDGKWGEPVAIKTEQEKREEKEKAIQAALAGLGPVKGMEQLEAERRERLALDATNRMNSLVQATGRWEQG